MLVADSVDKRRSLTKQLLSKATVVECSGPGDVAEAAKWVKDRVAQEGMAIDARAARLVADRVGPEVSRLRVGRRAARAVCGGNKAITEDDVKEVVAPATSHDDWGVTNAIERGSAGDALRELGADDGQRRRAVHDSGTARVVRAHQSAGAEGRARPSMRSSAPISPSRRLRAIRGRCWNGWWWSCAEGRSVRFQFVRVQLEFV